MKQPEPRYINKYGLYFQLVIVAALIILGPRACQLKTFSQTTGIVEGYDLYEKPIKYGTRIIRRPRITFMVDSIKYTLLSYEHIDGSFVDNAKVNVYYNPSNPNDAFLYQRQATWGIRPFLFGAIFLLLTILFFHPEIFPKKLRAT